MSNQQTTGPLRFPHMYKDMLAHRNPDKPYNIYIVGPGQIIYKNERNKFLSTPQFVEMAALFPNSKISLLDRDKTALQTLRGEFKKGHYYDLLMLHYFNLPDQIGKLPDYKAMLDRLADNLKKMSISNQDLASTTLRAKIPGKRVAALKIFDIIKNPFTEKEKGTFDIVVATLSIVNAISEVIAKDPKTSYFPCFSKFLDLLKVGGSLYIDSTLMLALKAQYPDDLNKILPNYKVRKIPLSEFLPNAQSDLERIPRASVLTQHKMITTTSIIVLTRIR